MKRHWKDRMHEIIYEADTKEGKLFDVVLLWLILASVVLVMLGSVRSLDAQYHELFSNAEWFITIFFTIEYICRIVCIKKPWSYIFSFYGIIDLFSTIPKYLSLIFGGAGALLAFRSLRLLRIFRILKLGAYVGESNKLKKAMIASKTKIVVFLFTIIILCVILGTVMFMIEGGGDSGFTSIPRGIYWAIVTMTTVGYGDIAPQTILGQLIASVVMIMGYGIIAIPTGIVSSEMTRQNLGIEDLKTQSCPNCSAENHAASAKYCYKCGSEISNR